MRKRYRVLLVLAFAVLLLPVVPASAQEPSAKSCQLGLPGPGLCHVNHDLGYAPKAFCQPRIYAGKTPWVCSVVEETTTGVTIQANNLDGSLRTGWVRFNLGYR